MIRYTSLSRAAISPGEAYELGQRALALGCDAGVIWNGKRRWVARASSRTYSTGRIGGFGTVYDALEAALDAYEAHVWTPGEIAQIAVQSGLEVSRA